MKRISLFLALCVSAFGQAIPDAVGVYNLSASGGGGGGSGTVTSVSFTGGLITVSSPTTAASLTVAGTSGGIPYFASTSTWASSSLLAANSLMIGGGAGAAPSTTTTGAGILAFLGTPSSANLATAVSDETGTGVLVFGTSPALTTSLTTPSTTFALLNTTATTVNAFGAATTVNTGASATQIWNFGGSTTASEFRFLEPSGSGTNYSAFKAVAQGANITYSLPPTVSAAGGALTDVAGNGVLTWVVPTGSGTVTTSGTITVGALLTAQAATAIQTPSATATMDSSGNISTPGTITVGNAATTAGAIALTQGTTQSAGTTNITIQAPTSVTSYVRTLPGAAGTGFYLGTNSAGVVTDTQVASTGTGNVVLSASPTLTGTIGAASLTLSSLTSGRATYAGASGLLSDEAAYAYNAATNILTVGGVSLGAGSEVSSIGPLVDSVDGTTPLNNINQVVATGTVYTLTTSFANVDFGTTDPVLTIANAGTYSIYVDVQTSLVTATTTTQSVSYKLRRTNNTAADLTGSTFGNPLPVATVGSPLGPSTHIGPIKYTTTNTNDSLTVQGAISGALGAGTATVSACTITAIRAY